jgi:hypothetical protein
LGDVDLRRLEINIKIDFRDKGYESVGWIHLLVARDRVQWRTFLNTAMNLLLTLVCLILKKNFCFLRSRILVARLNISFLRKTLKIEVRRSFKREMRREDGYEWRVGNNLEFDAYR